FDASAAAFAQNSAQLGIQVSDINRGAAPCEDFYEFANGSWRMANPIPSSMPRWSRRWAAAEATKDQLRQILEEISTVGNHPKGSVEQVAGDFYAACINVNQANRLGAQP